MSAKTKQIRRCECCHSSTFNELGQLVNEPIWALQYISDDEPSFYRLGSHIRGFGLIRVCDKCRIEIQAKVKEVSNE